MNLIMFLPYFFFSFPVVKYLNFYVNKSCNNKKKNIRNYYLLSAINIIKKYSYDFFNEFKFQKKKYRESSRGDIN